MDNCDLQFLKEIDRERREEEERIMNEFDEHAQDEIDDIHNLVQHGYMSMEEAEDRFEEIEAQRARLARS